MRLHTVSFHERVDTAYAEFSLITPEGYGLFLTAHAIVLGPAERAAGISPARRRHALLLEDLSDIGVSAPEESTFGPRNAGEAWARGVGYVLEGSRLGGALLARRVREDLPRRFLCARHGSGEWRDFLASLDDWAETQPEDNLRAALDGAETCFRAFEEAAHLAAASKGDFPKAQTPS